MGSSRVLLAGLPFRSWDQARTEPWGELLLIELTGSKREHDAHDLRLRHFDLAAVEPQEDARRHEGHALVAIVEGVVARQPVRVCRRLLHGAAARLDGRARAPW